LERASFLMNYSKLSKIINNFLTKKTIEELLVEACKLSDLLEIPEPIKKKKSFSL